jgi:excisionase family DNA binding protein
MRVQEPTVAALWPLQPRLLALKEAAAYLGVSTWTIRAYLADGRLQRVRLPGRGGGELERLLLDRGDLDALIEEGKA